MKNIYTISTFILLNTLRKEIFLNKHLQSEKPSISHNRFIIWMTKYIENQTTEGTFQTVN